VHLDVGAKTGSISVLIDGVKAESDGVNQRDAIVLDSARSTPVDVWINSLVFQSRSADAAIRINSGQWRLHYCGVSVSANVKYVVNDLVEKVTYTSSCNLGMASRP
jgi:hypothetical protein